MPRKQFVPSPTRPEDKLYLSTSEAAQLLGVGPITICKRIKSGQLKGSFVGRGWLVKRTDIDRYIESKIKDHAKVAA